MAQTVAEREVTSHDSKTAPAINQAIESVLLMIEARAGKQADVKNLVQLVRKII
jgi:hypothetical protein